jgi:hypothetical protein
MDATLTPGAQDEFLAVVLADEDLLRAEFDAIVSGSWPPPAHDQPPGPAGVPIRGRRLAETPAPTVRADQGTARLPTTARARYRSPPERCPRSFTGGRLRFAGRAVGAEQAQNRLRRSRSTLEQ